MSVRDEVPMEAAAAGALAQEGMRRSLASFGNLAAGETVASLLRFVGLIWVARQLGPGAFGTASAGYAVALYVTLFAHSGLDIVGTRALARDARHADRTLGEIVGLRLLLAAGWYVLLLAGTFAAPLADDVRLVVILFGGSVFTFALDVRWSFVGIQRTRPAAVAAAVSALSYLVGVIALVHRPGDLIRVPLVHVGAEAVMAAILMVASRRRFGRWRPTLPPDRLRPLLAASAPVTFMLGVRGLTITVDVVLARILLSGAEAGRYAAASRIATVGISYLGLYYVSLLPSVVRAFNRGPDAMRRLVRVALIRVLSIGPAVVLVATIATPPVVRLVLGPNYAGTARLLQVLLWGLLLLAFTGIYSSVLLAVDARRVLVGVTAVALAVNVVANVVLLPRVGVMGAAIATLLTEATMLALTWMAVRKHLRTAG
ncbi:MAG: oligosaccharide flippase family protein [Acidimicrobiales bacterium]